MAKKGSKRKMWTAEDTAFLEDNWGTLSVKQIARKLKRTEGAVSQHAVRSGLGRQIDSCTKGIPLKDLPELLGLNYTTISKTWIEAHHLKIHRVGKAYAYVTEDTLDRFMLAHPNLWNAKDCSYVYFQDRDWFLEALENSDKPQKWTKDEVWRMHMMRSKGMTFDEIAVELGRTRRSVCKKYNRMFGPSKPITTETKWKKEEIELLLRMKDEGYSVRQIANYLPYCYSVVYNKWRKLTSDPKTVHIPWQQEEIDAMVKMRSEGRTWKAIGEELCRPATSVRTKWLQVTEAS